jgi:hypothetical protein
LVLAARFAGRAGQVFHGPDPAPGGFLEASVMAIGLTKIAVNVSASGDNTLVAAPANTKQFFRVVAFFLQAGGSVNAKFTSGDGSLGSNTALTGPIPMTNGGPPIQGYTMPQTPHGIEGHFDTKPGERLNLNLSGNVAVTGWLVYAIVST